MQSVEGDRLVKGWMDRHPEAGAPTAPDNERDAITNNFDFDIQIEIYSSMNSFVRDRERELVEHCISRRE